MGVSLPERLREDSEESEDELVAFDQDEMGETVVEAGSYVKDALHGSCEGDADYRFGAEDDRAGELLCFLMDLQSEAMVSFGGEGGAAALEFDPKLYVDLPLKGALHLTKAAFRALPRGTTGSVAPGSCCATHSDFPW